MTSARAVWTIPASLPFLDTLVAGLFERHGRDPMALARIEIILPSRRACRSLTEAFLRASGGEPLLLPRLSALGDVDADEIELTAQPGDALDLPPAISALRRQLLLARLVRRWGRTAEQGEILPGQALALARELARLIDQVHTERVPLDRLDELVPDELAQHWQVTVRFLAIVRDHWPALLAAEGAIDPADRHNRLIEARVAGWAARPPATPIVAAGFASFYPATADLVEAVAGLPAGMVVLPGLDAGADDDLWTAIIADPGHPMQGMARFLGQLGLDRREVALWSSAPADGRAMLVREMMRPAAVTDRWRRLDPLPPVAFDGLSRLDLAGPHEEAASIALLLREALDRPDATAMLVTPDRGLARRVASELRRWTIEIDDSGGVPLARTPPGALLRLIGEVALDELAPVPLMALLKHPLVACGLAGPVFREEVRRLEHAVLRGPRPAPGIEGLRAVASNFPLVERIAETLEPFLALAGADDVQLNEFIGAHIHAAEALARTDLVPGAEILWAHDAGELLAGFIAEFAAASDDFEPIAGADYPVLFEAALAGRVVRPRFGRHARLQILGTLEARLQSADLVVLGGLNEGTWPASTGHDPWMSRPMRGQFGLASLEEQIGLAAQDFAFGFSAPRVVMTRAVRAEGTPTVPSRWLLRLDTVLRALQMERLPSETHAAAPAWASLIDEPAVIQSMPRPAPAPPVSARPRRLSVTEIETWRRDPYAIYARHVLRLKALAPLDEDPGVAERGTLIHEALARFVAAHPGALPAEAAGILETIGRGTFGAALARPGVWAFWWPRFLRIARWFIETEAGRRSWLAQSHVERSGRLQFDGPAAPFLLTAKADRIDRLVGGGLVVIDYKTGTVPHKEAVRLGYAPQLALEALIAEAGGFEGVPGEPVTELAFWRLSGGEEPGEIVPLDDPAGLASVARDGLVRLIQAFDDPATSYPARPLAAWAPRYSDYEHLARVLEWGAGEE